MTTWLDGSSTLRASSNNESRLDARWFNVKSPVYGAVGDGVANDTAAVASAMTAAAAVGGVLWFPPGTYLADVTASAGVSFRGAGRSSIIKGTTIVASTTRFYDLKFDHTGTRFFWALNTTDVIFNNCWMIGGTSSGNIYLNDNKITNVRFIDCEISGNVAGGNGVAIVDKGTAAKHFEDISFTRCWFHGNDRMNFECIMREDVGFPNVLGYRNINLFDCIFDGTAGSINVSYDSPYLADLSRKGSGHSIVRGCKITGGSTCLELAGPEGMLIEGNTITGPVTGDILSMSQYGSTTNERHIARIVGNRFRGGAGDSNVRIAGDGVSFTGNDIETPGALTLNGCNYSTVAGNRIEGLAGGYFGLQLLTSGNNTIVGNAIKGCVLFLYAATTDNIFVGNYLDIPVAAGGAAYNIVDGQQYIAHNIIRDSGPTTADRVPRLNVITYSASMTPDQASEFQSITPTNTTAFTINVPGTSQAGEKMTFDIGGLTGVMGAITWGTGTQFKLAGAFVNPASTKRRTISFYFDGASWIETSRAAADI